MIEAKDIRAGMIFWESDMGMHIKCQALTDATEIREPMREGYTFKAQLLEGNAALADEKGVITYFEAFECYAYGLKLYAESEVVRYYG